MKNGGRRISKYVEVVLYVYGGCIYRELLWSGRRAERAESWKLETIGKGNGNGNGNVYIKRVRSWALETPPAPKNEVKSHRAQSVD